MTSRTLSRTTALLTSLTLALPQGVLIGPALAQDQTILMLCLDMSLPPCPPGEPIDGTPTPVSDPEAALAAAADLTEIRIQAAEAEAAAAEAAAADAAAAEAAAAEAAAAEAAAAEAAAAEAAAAEAAAADAAAAEAAAADAAAAEAAAQAAADAAAAEAADNAAAEAAAAEAAAAEAAAAEAAATEAAAAEAAAAAESEPAEDSVSADALAASQAIAADAASQAEGHALAAADVADRLAELAAVYPEIGDMADTAADASAQASAFAADAAAAATAANGASSQAESEAAAAAAITALDDAAFAAQIAADALAHARTRIDEIEAAAAAAVATEAEPATESTSETEAAPEAEATTESAPETVEPEVIVDDTTTEEVAPELVEALSDLSDPTAELTGAAAPEAVEEVVVTETAARSSSEEFATAADGRGASRSGLSDLEKILLFGMGAIIVGSILNNGDEVVSNSGDRVVVKSDDGYTIYKDDDALLRQPGTTVRTETFSDGSTRTILSRPDGSQVVTIRDAHGRVLRRARVLPDGTQIQLFDDLVQVAPVTVSTLSPNRPRPQSISVAEADRAALRAAMRRELAYDPGRTFSLRQIREIAEVRELVPGIDLDTITFASGSAAIPPEQARSLVRLGILIEEFLAENPREVFLIEGHTDATGSDALNLALSDRRAESVALALTEFFAIEPENLVVQGYGERFLKIDTQAAEPANRRATIRRITPLLNQIAAN